MSVFELVMIPVVGGVIGWITNLIAIRLLFRPYRPLRIPLLHAEIIGLIPKRHREISEKIGKVVEEELLTVDDLWHSLRGGQVEDHIVEAIIAQMEKRIGDRLPFFMQGIKPMLLKNLGDILEREVRLFFLQQMDGLVQGIRENVSISKIVQEKINSLSLQEVEALIVSVAKQELKHIEVLGGVLGFLIGMIQVIVLLIFSHP